MKYEEVSDHLQSLFPTFIIDEDDKDLQYIVAGNFAHYLLEEYKNNTTHTLVLAGEFIENLHLYNDHKVQELATIGYLEAIQNVWDNNETDPNIFLSYLGKASTEWWHKLNDFWNGNPYALSNDE